MPTMDEMLKQYLTYTQKLFDECPLPVANEIGGVEEFMLPMDDGVRLRTTLWKPAGKNPYPLILLRSCYPGQEVLLRLKTEEVCKRGSGVMLQWCRGTGGSEGVWEPNIYDRADGLATQQVRGAIVLPNGTGKSVKVLVFAKGPKADEAKAAGADFVGDMDMVEKIQKENWFDFDVVVATPDMMGVVGRLGKVLGPKGLMPSPKAGTVTMDVTRAVNEIKAGKIEYRLDKTNIIHCPIGKASFGPEKLEQNFRTLMEAVIKAKPSAAKGQYLRSVVVASTMGPGIKINAAKLS